MDETSDDKGLARFQCGECGVITHVYPNLKVQIRVPDATGSASFVLFERDVTNYFNKSVSQFMSNHNQGDAFELYPVEFSTLVGKRFAFKIKVSEYNIDNKYYVYTVNKFSDEDVVIKEILKKTTGDEDSTADDDIQFQVMKQVGSQVGPSAKFNSYPF